MNIVYPGPRGRKKTIRDDNRCLVCGESAIGVNFGVLTCSPCKAFFRRNAVKLGVYDFQCDGNGDCPITRQTRRQCNCCRLAKCFRVGMDRTTIRTEDFRLENSQSQRISLIRSSNILRSPSVSLSSNDQTLLTNICNAYEKTCVVLTLHHIFNVVNDENLSLGKLMNNFSHVYTSSIEYFKLIPEFANLSYTSKKSLLLNNLNQIAGLNNLLAVKEIRDFDDSSASICKTIFPSDLFAEMLKCKIALEPFAYDPLLLKLLLIILIFSTHLNIRYQHNSIEYEDNQSTLHLFHIQNIYVDLLWNYLLNRFSNSRQAIIVLSSFVSHLIRSQYINIKLNEFILNIISNQNNQLIPLMRTLWLNEETK